jgi:hypothetical protein
LGVGAPPPTPQPPIPNPQSPIYVELNKYLVEKLNQKIIKTKKNYK